jgi:mono/diheme cytochrome c family protein
MHALVFVTALLLGTTANAQGVGDPQAGQRIAGQLCASCHAIMLGEGVDPHPDPLPFDRHEALPFEDIANTPGITAMALFAWLSTSHPTMPNILLEKEDMQNVVAYILTLKKNQ